MTEPPGNSKIGRMDATALCERLEVLAREMGEEPILAFDADGTLWQGDVTRDLVSYAMGRRPLLPDGLARLRAIAEAHGLAVADDVHEQMGVLVLGYSTGHLPEAAAVEGVLLGFAGHRQADFETLVDEAIRCGNLTTRMHPTIGRIFDWAASRGMPTVVVSASPRAAVERALRVIGLQVDAVLGAEPRVDAGRLLPELAAPVLVGTSKATALGAHTSRPLLAAFGDDVRDLALLASGRLAVAVDPTDALRARLGEVRDVAVLLPTDRDTAG